MEHTKPKIMRRVAFSQTEEARTCLGCGFVLLKKKLPTWLNRTTCPRCHTGMQFKHTDHGTVVITNEEFADWFVHDGHPAQIWIREENEVITVEKPSNADKVRAMDDLTLADFMYRIAYCGCTREDMYEWLKLESDDSWQKELMRFREELNK